MQTASGKIQLKSGINLISEIQVKKLGGPVQQLFTLLKISNTTIIPVRVPLGSNGIASLAMPAFGQLKAANLPSATLSNLSFSGPSISLLNSAFGPDFVKTLKFTSKLPENLKFSNISLPFADFVISGGGGTNLEVSVDAPSFSFANMPGSDLSVFIDADAKNYALNGTLSKDSAKNFASFPKRELLRNYYGFARSYYLCFIVSAETSVYPIFRSLGPHS